MGVLNNIHDKTNLAKYITNALGYAVPPPFLFNKVLIVAPDEDSVDSTQAQVAAIDKSSLQQSNAHNYIILTPLKLRNDTMEFQFPLDVLVSVSGKNIITRRYVAKGNAMRGSIKEYWSQDDYDVQIAGVLITEDQNLLSSQIRMIRSLCESPQTLQVESDLLLNTFDIKSIAVESFDFPFTKGMENQAFSIRAYSDDAYQLLEE